MQDTFEKVARQALELSRPQRLTLAGLLLELEDTGADPAAEAEWDREIRARIKAVDEGTAVGVPYEQVMQEADKRLVR